MAKAKPSAKLGRLPEWDFSALYLSMDSPALAKDIKRAGVLADAFAKAYTGKVSTMEGDALAHAVGDYETLQETLGKISSYAQLLYAKKMSDPAVVQFYQNTQETLTTLSTRTLFFTLDINKLSDARMQQLLKSKALARYVPWLRDVRSWKSYQLSDEMEQLLLEKHVSGVAAWNRLFDETITALRFPLGKKMLTEPEVMELMSGKDGDLRKQAALSIGSVFKENAPLFTLITNTLAKDKEVEDRFRKLEAPISGRNVSNQIEDEVVEALLSAVRESYAETAHRYYKFKAKCFGKKALDYWDRNAPLPFDDDRLFKWEEAQELVLSSYRAFSPRLADVGAQFFDHGWIDASVQPGKSPGAFAHQTVPSAHPFLLLNYQGRNRDVMTLAHELGHGVHQVLSARQGQLMCDTPLTLAETASVFGEQLTFRELLKRTQSPQARVALLASKVEDMLNTVVRQAAFCQFEILLHDARKKGELSTTDINALWMKVQSESLGPAVKLHGDYGYFWSYIPHFIHSPFYVYAYAFGDCLVNALYAVYEREAELGRAKQFEDKYIDMLKAGGTLRHKELLAPFGLDASKPSFWKQGLNIISGMIDELEG